MKAKRSKRCRRCGHTHHTRYALCWSQRKGLFVCRCRNHPLGVVSDADAAATPTEDRHDGEAN